MLGFFVGELIFGGAIIGGNFSFQNLLANANSPCAYIWEALLSEGYLRLRFGGLIFGRASFFLGGGRGLLSEFYGILLTLQLSVATDEKDGNCVLGKNRHNVYYGFINYSSCQKSYCILLLVLHVYERKC